jgi:hypothetical protein
MMCPHPLPSKFGNDATTKESRCSVWGDVSDPAVDIGPVRYSVSDADHIGKEATIRVREFPPSIETRDIEGWCIHIGTETFAGEIVDVSRSGSGYHELECRGREP